MRRAACTILIACFLLATTYAVADSSSSGGLSDSNLSLINEAVQKIQKVALNFPKSGSVLTRDIIDAYAKRSDPYADYLGPQEYSAYLEAADADYFGVQMELVAKDNRILMYPFAGGVADRGGVRAGDELIAINGNPVYGKSIFLAGVEIRGAKDEVVQLIVRSDSEIARTVTLRRKGTSYSAVSMMDSAKVRYIRISRFTAEVDDDLLALFMKMPPDIRVVVIDLRQNHGGSLNSARKCADLFLPEETPLYFVKQRGGLDAISALEPAVVKQDVILIQDENTASAAEIFIAALTHNGRALSVGQKSYGKGQAQRFVELSDGSAILLTFAELLTAGQNQYHGKGLIPTKSLPETLLQADFTRGEILEKLLSFIGDPD